MADTKKQVVKDNIWRDRLDSATKYYDTWERLFKCKILEQYYEGIQWKSQKEIDYTPYVFNKLGSTIQFKIAEFLPTFPKFIVNAIPSAEEYDLDDAAATTEIKEATLNTIIQNENVHFAEELEQAYKDSFFRFGMIEVGYAADWILNPQAGKPLLKKDADRDIGYNQRSQIKRHPDELPVNERVYFKHIAAKRFRVGGLDHRYLSQCDWCGYYEYVNRDDLLSIKGLINQDKIQNAQGTTYVPDDKTDDYKNDNNKGNNLKIWHIWNRRAMTMLLVLDAPTITIYQKKYKRLPLFDLRWDRRTTTEGFYPIPPAYNWISPQDELNETREMLRTHRRRFIRKFQVMEGGIDDAELEKFESGPDGALVKVKRDEAIKPIDNADLGASLNEAIQVAGSDFNELAGISNQDLEVPDRSTATEANIINQKGSVRELKDRDRMTFWFARIGREVLMVAKERFTTKFWIRLNSQEGEDHTFGDINAITPVIKWITAEDLDDYDFKVDVDVTSVSTTAQQDEKQKFLEFLGVLTQFPAISFSPLLVREAAYRVGYNNERVIKEMQKMALTAEIGRQLQMQAQIKGTQSQISQIGQPQQQPQNPMTPPNGNAGQAIVAQQTPPNVEQVRNQLQNQLGVTQ